MKRESKIQKRVKRQNSKKRKSNQKINKKSSLLDDVKFWFERHSRLASLIDGGIILFSIFGIMYVFFGMTLIPKAYQELSYVFPIIINFVFLVNTIYQGVFRDGFSKKTSV